MWQAILTQSFMQHALLAILLAGVVAGVTGTLVMVRRVTLIGGAIAHAVLGGVGVFYLLDWPPMLGAFAAAVVAALVIGMVKLRLRQHEDTVISAVWAVGMAVGLICMQLKPGYGQDLMSFLFGNLLLVTRAKLLLLGIFTLVVLVVVGVFYRQILAVCFDPVYARVRGLREEALELLTLVLVAFTIVVLIQVAGLILVIALLTFPAAVAGMFMRTPAGMMAMAAALSLVFNLSGFAIAWLGELPPGATMVLVAGIGYLIAFQLKNVVTRNKHATSRTKRTGDRKIVES